MHLVGGGIGYIHMYIRTTIRMYGGGKADDQPFIFLHGSAPEVHALSLVWLTMRVPWSLSQMTGDQPDHKREILWADSTFC